MKLYIKSQLPMYVLVFGMQLLMIWCLLRAEQGTIYEVCNQLLGNESFTWVVEQVGFIIIVLLVQLLNGSMMVYYLRNKSYFLIRAVSTNKQLDVVFRKTIVNIAIFFVLYLLAACLLHMMFYAGFAGHFLNEYFLSAVKGFGKMFIFSGLQLLFLIIMNQEMAFVSSIACVFAFAFMNLNGIVIPIDSVWVRGIVVFVLFTGAVTLLMQIIKVIYRRGKFV